VKSYHVSIKGESPLLQHGFGVEFTAPTQNTRTIHVENSTPRQEAEKVQQRLPDGRYYIVGAAFARLLREAGGSHKQKGSRKSMKYVIPGAVFVQEDAVVILNGDGKTPAKDFEVDSRPVVIPSTKGRIMRHRPRFDHWSADFTLLVNDGLIDPDFVNKLLVHGSQAIGVGDFRPERGGPFGRFIVTRWEPVKA
jgi:hypothetical protein